MTSIEYRTRSVCKSADVRSFRFVPYVPVFPLDLGSDAGDCNMEILTWFGDF
jgi:hypothetical protein